jgi:hypothetical protein
VAVLVEFDEVDRANDQEQQHGHDKHVLAGVGSGGEEEEGTKKAGKKSAVRSAYCFMVPQSVQMSGLLKRLFSTDGTPPSWAHTAAGVGAWRRLGIETSANTTARCVSCQWREE